ncbi:MAG: GNAT family N-acetyltransferase [Tissierellia bacterium]|nr:GNAT family N-acetyltransferase [Tissierellia bacterium]
MVVIEYQIFPMTYDDAKEISSWRYEEYYSIYNIPFFEKIYSPPLYGEVEFYSIFKNEELYGHFRVKNFSNFTLLGLAFKPKYCGQGLGTSNMNLILSFLKEHGVKKIRLNVRDTNARAKKCYINVGFTPVGMEVMNVNNTPTDFMVMEKEL